LFVDRARAVLEHRAQDATIRGHTAMTADDWMANKLHQRLGLNDGQRPARGPPHVLVLDSRPLNRPAKVLAETLALDFRPRGVQPLKLFQFAGEGSRHLRSSTIFRSLPRKSRANAKSTSICALAMLSCSHPRKRSTESF